MIKLGKRNHTTNSNFFFLFKQRLGITLIQKYKKIIYNKTNNQKKEKFISYTLNLIKLINYIYLPKMYILLLLLLELEQLKLILSFFAHKWSHSNL